MLKDQVLSTLRFFDLQDFPLTLTELCMYLVAEPSELGGTQQNSWEYAGQQAGGQPAGMDEILQCLEQDCRGLYETDRGFYFLPGRSRIVAQRLLGYLGGIGRQRRIWRYSGFLRHIPFVRGAALSGSQALGQQKESSDIDLLIFTDPAFLWLARTLVTGYFQLIGMRRHGRYVAGRFCLNHYIAGTKELSAFRNLYTALEYAKLRPLAYPQAIARFQVANRWIQFYLPNFSAGNPANQPQSRAQYRLEQWLGGRFGKSLERILKSWQQPKIRQEKFIIVEMDELSFHPDSKQQYLLQRFFSPSAQVLQTPKVTITDTGIVDTANRN